MRDNSEGEEEWRREVRTALFILLLASVTWGQQGATITVVSRPIVSYACILDSGGSLDDYRFKSAIPPERFPDCLNFAMNGRTRHTHPPLPEPSGVSLRYHKWAGYVTLQSDEGENRRVPEPIDVPAIHYQCVASGPSMCCARGGDQQDCPKYLETWRCKDHSRIKLQSEDGKWWCHKVQE